jgi:hypothetical protein
VTPEARIAVLEEQLAEMDEILTAADAMYYAADSGEGDAYGAFSTYSWRRWGE